MLDVLRLITCDERLDRAASLKSRCGQFLRDELLPKRGVVEAFLIRTSHVKQSLRLPLRTSMLALAIRHEFWGCQAAGKVTAKF